eukprot:534969-Prymnesium_polylepis.1
MVPGGASREGARSLAPLALSRAATPVPIGAFLRGGGGCAVQYHRPPRGRAITGRARAPPCAGSKPLSAEAVRSEAAPPQEACARLRRSAQLREARRSEKGQTEARRH